MRERLGLFHREWSPSHRSAVPFHGVTAYLKRGGNEQGEAVSDADMQRLLLAKHAICPQWNYTLSPRPEAEQMAK